MEAASAFADQMFARMSAAHYQYRRVCGLDLPKGKHRAGSSAPSRGDSQPAFLPFPFDSVIAGGASMAYRRCSPDPSYHVRFLSAYPSGPAAIRRWLSVAHSTPL